MNKCKGMVITKVRIVVTSEGSKGHAVGEEYTKGFKGIMFYNLGGGYLVFF